MVDRLNASKKDLRYAQVLRLYRNPNFGSAEIRVSIQSEDNLKKIVLFAFVRKAAFVWLF